MIDFDKLKNVLLKDKYRYLKVIEYLEKPYFCDGTIWQKNDTYIYFTQDTIIPILIGKKDDLKYFRNDFEEFIYRMEFNRKSFFLEGMLFEFMEDMTDIFNVQNITITDTFYLKPRSYYKLNYFMSTLTFDDIDFIDSVWPFRWDDENGTSKDLFRECIADNPSVALRVNNELVAFAIIYTITDELVNLGHLYVKPEYRKHGFGQEVTKYLLNRVYELGKTAVVYIKEDNIPSASMSQKAGFIKSDKIIWGDIIIG